MPYAVRRNETNGWRPKYRSQTEVDVEIQNWKCPRRHLALPTLYDISSYCGLVIPPQRAYKVQPGNLYVRRHKYGKEFVRSREREETATMCKHCEQNGFMIRRRSGATIRQTAFGQQEAQHFARVRALEAELEAAEARESQPIPERTRRPYAHVPHADIEDRTPPPETAEEAQPRRRVSFAPAEQRHSHAYTGCGCHGHHPPHAYADYHVHDNYPPTSYRQSYRRPSYVCQHSRAHHHDSIPLLFQRIIMGGRRRRNSGAHDGCTSRRISNQVYCEMPDVRYEMRAPEDYYYY